MPPHSTINPRLATVDQASTFLASLVVMAANDPARNVTEPTRATSRPTEVPEMTGAMRTTRYTPAFTIVLECNSADTGVGATMAPSNQLENGSCADLVMPAKQSSAAG